MAIRTYYHILGVSRDATQDEITAAKNALAKVYHPDANMKNGIDTTARMQEILEAYRVLSNPEKRAKYDRKLGGGTNRVFRTFTMNDANKKETTSMNQDTFVTYWTTSNKLMELVSKSAQVLELESKNESFKEKILKKFGKSTKSEQELHQKLEKLALEALSYITILKNAEIPMDYWLPEAMNWCLIHWSQNQHLDYHTVFAKYDAHLNQNKSNAERLKIHAQNKHFHNQLKKLLTYAL